MSAQAKSHAQAGRVGLLLVASLLWPGGLLAQTPPTDPPQAQPSAPAVVTQTAKQTGAAAWQLLVGNTVVADSRAGNYTEFYKADGVVQHLDRDGKTAGKWTLEGQKVCFDFPEEDDRSCVSIEVEGSKGAFVDEDASRDLFVILPGNAKSL